MVTQATQPPLLLPYKMHRNKFHKKHKIINFVNLSIDFKVTLNSVGFYTRLVAKTLTKMPLNRD